MAEAVVEDRPQPPQKFYCHLCNVEIQSVNADYTCPLCSNGFIEEIQETNEPAPEDVEMQDANRIDDFDVIRDELATLLMPLASGGGGIGVGVANRPTESENTEEDTSGGGGGSASVEPRQRRTSRRGLRMPNIGRFDNVLLEILQTLSGNNDPSMGNTSMFFMGNPGDYAWGREGIDTIVTQLLNQMDTSGPPPLPKDKIDEIPKVDITQEQVDLKLQCSVCWEDFEINETVRKLPCLHLYHENCIVPWLELHGTCPICRKSLSPEGQDVSNTIQNAAASTIRAFQDSINREVNDMQTNATSSSSSSSQQQQQHQQQQQNQQQQQQPSQQQQQQQPPSQQQQQQRQPHDFFSAIPLSLSRLFPQPGTSSQSQQPFIFSLGAFPPVPNRQQNQQQQQQHQDQQQQQPCDSNISSSNGGGGGGSGSGNTTRTTTQGTNNQMDIFRNDDDGNVDFEFD